MQEIMYELRVKEYKLFAMQCISQNNSDNWYGTSLKLLNINGLF